MHRGSRKHILDWVSQPRFLPELLALAEPARCLVSATSQWRPLGGDKVAEARLESFGPATMPDHGGWTALQRWWLERSAGANTPNWDLALSCEVEGRPGLVLVEAKANVPELSRAGKTLPAKASDASKANHNRIGLAIAAARDALTPMLPGLAIDRETHYQLSNRLAFAWKLASLGIPTVLVYLGFTGDEGIRDVGEPFSDDAHWQNSFVGYISEVWPSPVLDRAIAVGDEAFWVLSRSRPVLESSLSRS